MIKKLNGCFTLLNQHLNVEFQMLKTMVTCVISFCVRDFFYFMLGQHPYQNIINVFSKKCKFFQSMIF